MSIVKNSKYGWFISHNSLIQEVYKEVVPSQLNPELFNINTPYKPSKNCKVKAEEDNQKDPFFREVQHVEESYKQFYEEIKPLFEEVKCEVRNDDAVNTASEIYEKSGKNLVTDLYGANPEAPVIKTINKTQFLFPENCKFYAKDVKEMSMHLKDEKFDVVLLDPPWWNKYIRRKRKHTQHGYDMMFNEDLKNLSLENHLKSDALVVVWCTNSCQHFNTLINEVFPKWGVKYMAKWYWVKVTKAGIPVCHFSPPPRKQPFEQIIFGCVTPRTLPNPPNDKLVLSVPSALHSHKPPLIRLLEPFLPKNPNCLEVFARYLLPNWSSYGKEVLRLQHECLYK